MSQRAEGFESRECFCIVSRGDPKQAIRDNHHTILHQVWTQENFYPDGNLSAKKIAWGIPAYLMGMIGYAVETLLVKIILAIGNTLAFFVSLCCSDRKWKKDRGIVCLDSWAALGISIIGILVPPLAYRLDAAARETMLGLLD